LITKGLTILVIPLPLLVFAKITSHMDRHLTKDLLDILYVLEHYEEVSISERRFEILEAPNLSYEERGAYLLGMELRNILAYEEVEMVLLFLEDFKNKFSVPVQTLSREARKTVEEILDLFKAFFRGIENKQ